MKIRAKMKVETITLAEYADIIKMRAVFDNDPNHEDNTYTKATPAASLEMQIDNPEARGQFKAGAKYYIDFTEVN